MKYALKKVPLHYYIFTGFMAVALAVYYVLFNYKPFVDFYFAIGDPPNSLEDFSPDYAGVAYSTRVPVESAIIMESRVLQPSGISISDQGILVVSDTSEAFWLSHDGMLIASVKLKKQPLLLRQGVFEGITWTGPDTAAVIGEEGNSLLTLSVKEKALTIDESIDISSIAPKEVELQSLAYDEESQTIYSVYGSANGIVTKIELNKKGELIKKQDVTYDSSGTITHEVLGVSLDNGFLYLLTNNNIVIKMNDKAVQEIVALDYEKDSSGIAVYKDRIYIVTDHEYYEESPPLFRFDYK